MAQHMSPHALEERSGMPFFTALNYLLKGHRVRRLDWDDVDVYLSMGIDEKIAEEKILMIYKTEDNKLHPLILSEADIIANDWVIFKPS